MRRLSNVAAIGLLWVGCHASSDVEEPTTASALTFERAQLVAYTNAPLQGPLRFHVLEASGEQPAVAVLAQSGAVDRVDDAIFAIALRDRESFDFTGQASLMPSRVGRVLFSLFPSSSESSLFFLTGTVDALPPEQAIFAGFYDPEKSALALGEDICSFSSDSAPLSSIAVSGSGGLYALAGDRPYWCRGQHSDSPPGDVVGYPLDELPGMPNCPEASVHTIHPARAGFAVETTCGQEVQNQVLLDPESAESKAYLSTRYSLYHEVGSEDLIRVAATLPFRFESSVFTADALFGVLYGTSLVSRISFGAIVDETLVGSDAQAVWLNRAPEAMLLDRLAAKDDVLCWSERRGDQRRESVDETRLFILCRTVSSDRVSELATISAVTGATVNVDGLTVDRDRVSWAVSHVKGQRIVKREIYTAPFRRDPVAPGATVPDCRWN